MVLLEADPRGRRKPIAFYEGNEPEDHGLAEKLYRFGDGFAIGRRN